MLFLDFVNMNFGLSSAKLHNGLSPLAADMYSSFIFISICFEPHSQSSPHRLFVLKESEMHSHNTEILNNLPSADVSTLVFYEL